MTVLHKQYSPIHERLSAECSHGKSGIVRGVVSGTETEASKILPSAHEHTTRGFQRNRHITDCECGLPAYLTDLDEPLIDYAFANFIAFINRANKTERVKSHIVSAIIRTEFPNDLR